MILLGGRDITSFSRGEWARAVSLVSQEPVLFSGESSISTVLDVCEQAAALLSAANPHSRAQLSAHAKGLSLVEGPG